ncbi:hypothetical protein [Hydrogenophaga sp.]|uniref:hypothetical protein n=1 Tax=Hydrogenophaga sp. TaxID=1904254 RepID=UPI00271E6756|nr:hypothetical protein [Hydrogenophaga sp.]MDO9434445.1 hypothetical protein [Hydrogenophaga sp.]
MTSIRVTNVPILSQGIAVTDPRALLPSATAQQLQNIGASTQEIRDALVVEAFDAARKLSGIDQDLAQIASLKGQLQEIEAGLNKAIQSRAPGATVSAQETLREGVIQKKSELEKRASIKASALDEIRDLTVKRYTAQTRLDGGGLGTSQVHTLNSELAHIHAELRRAQFQATEGGCDCEYMAHLAQAIKLEAATLRSQLAVGGLSLQDKQRIDDRLFYLAETLAPLEKELAGILTPCLRPTCVARYRVGESLTRL